MVRYLLVLAAALAITATMAPAGDWPIFRGNPHQTGVADSALPEQLEIRWQYKTKDSIEGTAAIARGVAYIGSFDEHLYALALDTGKMLWSYKAGPIKAPVGVKGDRVYVGNADGIFHCVETVTGKKSWTYETGAEITSGPDFTENTVLFGSGDETLYCLSLDGKEKWKFKVPGGPVMGTPAIVGNRTFAAGCDSTLHVIDIATGKEAGPTVDLGGQVGASVAVMGDRLYVGTISSQVLGIDWKKGETVWKFEGSERRQPFIASAALTDQLVVTASRDKHVYALDRKTGEKVWSFATRNRVEGSPVISGNRVYVGSTDGNLYVLDLPKGTELARFKLGTSKLGTSISGSAAVADGCLVIGTNDGTVYCLGQKK
jgi:outer membrane protein assembly factor BamB